MDLRGCSDAQLRLQRATYEQETAWAPPHVGEELRLARMQVRAAFENATREGYEARAAKDAEARSRHARLAGMWTAMEAKATQVADILAEAQEARRQWEALTEHTRRIAVAADRELRGRHPGQFLEPLTSAEPAGITSPRPADPPSKESWVQPTLDGSIHLHLPRTEAAETAAEERPLKVQEREIAGQEALDLSPESAFDGVPVQVLRIRENATKAQEKIDDLRGMRIPADDQDAMDLGTAWSVLARREREAVIQPPRPQIAPASEIIKRAHERMAVHEPEPA